MGSDVWCMMFSNVVFSFNSRSRMGSDKIVRWLKRGFNCFNSRSRMGSDFGRV